MNRLSPQIRRPVQRQHADEYLLITLLSFAASVAGTRLFLELTGYPQLGGRGLHIAHVLWGGLLLFIATLLPLLFANRWVYPLTAALSGLGIGLFIDEVGKFITTNNDYFFPAAAPIIYAFFILTVLVYTRIRRPPPPDARSELYHAFDVFEEVLDHDLEPLERIDLQTRLKNITQQSDHPELAQLATALLEYLDRKDINLVAETPGLLERFISRCKDFEARFVKELRLRALLIGGLGGLGLVSMINLLQYITARFSPDIRINSASITNWFLARVFLEGLVAFMLLTSAILLLIRQIPRGLTYSYYSLIISLTVVNLLVFYFNQFSTIVPALIQFTFLVLVIYYRRHFLHTGAI
jgi:hypothetical protein